MKAHQIFFHNQRYYKNIHNDVRIISILALEIDQHSETAPSGLVTYAAPRGTPRDSTHLL